MNRVAPIALLLTVMGSLAHAGDPCAPGAPLDGLEELAKSDPTCAARQLESDDPAIAARLSSIWLLSDRVALAIALAPKAGPRAREQLALALENADADRLIDPARDRLHHLLCDGAPQTPRLAQACAKEGPDRTAAWLDEFVARERAAHQLLERERQEEARAVQRARRNRGLIGLAAAALFFVFVLLLRNGLFSRIALALVGGATMAVCGWRAILFLRPDHRFGGLRTMALLGGTLVAGALGLWLIARARGARRVVLGGAIALAMAALAVVTFLR